MEIRVGKSYRFKCKSRDLVDILLGKRFVALTHYTIEVYDDMGKIIKSPSGKCYWECPLETLVDVVMPNPHYGSNLKFNFIHDNYN